MRYLLLFSFLFISEMVLAQKLENESFIHSQDLFNSKMNPKVSCYRIPALLCAKNGVLLAAIDERINSCADVNGNDNINIVIRSSRDNGLSWSDIRTIVDYPEGKSASDPSFILDTKTGTIFLFYNYMDRLKEKDIYYLHVIKSTDHGYTWSEPEDITSQITKVEWKNDFKFITSGKGTQTAFGTLLHTLVNLKFGVFIFGSLDHGRTWFLKETPIKSADESKIIELKDGTWMVNSRVNKLGMRYVSTSIDQGESWESMKEISLIDPSCNAAIIRYKYKSKNCLLFVNAAAKDSRRNLNLKISYDEGKSWSAGKTVFPGSAAYSDIVVLKNGDLGILFEKNNYQENVFVRIPFKWLEP